MEPINQPLITHLLVQEWWEKAQTPKPTALDTPLRYSSAYACQRQQSYAAFDVAPTEPMDIPGAWVTGVGTLIHEALQEAIARAYPDAQFEVGTKHGDFISGSCDAYIPEQALGADWRGGNVLYELKTMGTYSFDKQVGWNRMRGEFKYPEGPAKKAIAQAGINALGIEKALGVTIDTVILGSMTFEALSKTKAAKMGVNDINRVHAEWHFSRSEWLPLAEAELARAGALAAFLEQGYLGDRLALDDEGNVQGLDPNSGKYWQCDYCAFRSVCATDGPGVLHINDSTAVPNQKEGE